MEVQRLNSVADKAFPHRAKKELLLSSGHDIPKGAMIFFWLGEVQKDQKIFPNPKTLNPNRFLDETGSFTPNAKVIVFGTGLRRCPGETFA